MELKLTTSRIVHDDELSAGKFADGLEEQTSDEISCQTSANCSDVQKFKRGKQLLQFDKSHRPAFYGTWPKKR